MPRDTEQPMPLADTHRLVTACNDTLDGVLHLKGLFDSHVAHSVSHERRAGLRLDILELSMLEGMLCRSGEQVRHVDCAMGRQDLVDVDVQDSSEEQVEVDMGMTNFLSPPSEWRSQDHNRIFPPGMMG